MMISNFPSENFKESFNSQASDASDSATADQPDAEFASLLAGFCVSPLPVQQNIASSSAPAQNSDASLMTVKSVGSQAATFNLTDNQTPKLLGAEGDSPLQFDQSFFGKSSDVQNADNSFLPNTALSAILPSISNLLTTIAKQSSNENKSITLPTTESILPVAASSTLTIENPSTLSVATSAAVPQFQSTPDKSGEVQPILSLDAFANSTQNNLPTTKNEKLSHASIEIVNSNQGQPLDSSSSEILKLSFDKMIAAPVLEAPRFKALNLSLRNAFKNDAADGDLTATDAKSSVAAVQKTADFFDINAVDSDAGDNAAQLFVSGSKSAVLSGDQPANQFDFKTTEKFENQTENTKNVFSQLIANKQTNNEKASVQTSETISVPKQIESSLVDLAAKTEVRREPQVVKLRLRPEELGTVEIRLEKTASGDVKAHLQTETETARQILTENLQHLRDALQSAGWKVDRLDVSCNAFANSNFDKNGNNSAQPQQFDYQVDNRDAAQAPISETSVSATVTNRLLSVRA